MKQKNKTMQNLLGGTISLTVATVMVKFLGLIYKMPISQFLGDEGMGYFNSAYTIYSFFYLLCSAGVPKAIMILVCDSLASKNKMLEGQILKTALRFFSITGLAASASFALFSEYLAKLIGNNNASLTMLFISPSIFFVSLSGVIKGYISAHSKLIDVAASQIIEGVGKLAFGLLFAWYGYSINLPVFSLSALSVLGVTLGSFASLIFLSVRYKILYKRDKSKQNTTKEGNREVLKKILSISLPITVSSALLSLTGIIDLGLIMRMLAKIGYSESEASSLYGNYTTLAVPMFNLVISLLAPISIAYLPIFSKEIHEKNDKQLKAYEAESFGIVSLICAPCAVGFSIYGKEILYMLFPGCSADIGGAMLCLLCPAMVLYSLLLIVNTLHEASGSVKVPMLSMVIGSGIKILLSYILISDPKFGISGAPIGTTLSYCVSLIISTLIYIKVVSRTPCIKLSAILPYIIAIMSAILSRSVYNVFTTNTNESLSLLLSLTIYGILYIVVYLFYGIRFGGKIIKLAKYTNFLIKNYPIRRKVCDNFKKGKINY